MAVIVTTMVEEVKAKIQMKVLVAHRVIRPGAGFSTAQLSTVKALKELATQTPHCFVGVRAQM